MNIKLVVLDMDGTLLDNNHEVSKTNKEAISRLKKQGIKFILASGRPYESIYPYIKDLALDLPVIASNGAFVKSPVDHKIHLNSLVPLDLAQEVVDYALKHKYSVSLYYEEEIVTFDEKMMQAHWELEGVKATLAKNITVDQAPEKIIYYDEPKRITKASDILEKEYKNKLYVTCSGDNYLDFMNLEASKGNALSFLMKEMGIGKSQVMVMGNNYNDVSMFHQAGRAIAMENSPQEVKELADYVTKSNMEDGVAIALGKFIK